MDIHDIFGASTEADKETLAIERMTVGVQIAICRAMEAGNISRSDLARRIGVSPARVSQMLGGDGSNLTIKSIAKIARAIEANFEFCWVDAPEVKAAIELARGGNSPVTARGAVSAVRPKGKFIRIVGSEWEDVSSNNTVQLEAA